MNVYLVKVIEGCPEPMLMGEILDSSEQRGGAPQVGPPIQVLPPTALHCSAAVLDPDGKPMPSTQPAWTLVLQVGAGPPTSASPGKLLKMHSFRSIPDTKSKFLGLGPSNLCIKKLYK